MEIKGRDILKIAKISTGNKYDVEKDHKFSGKTYDVYQFRGIAFTVPTEHEFVAWRDSAKLYSVDFTEGERDVEIKGEMVKVKTLQLLSCTNKDQEIEMARTEDILNKIYKEADVVAVEESYLDEFVKN